MVCFSLGFFLLPDDDSLSCILVCAFTLRLLVQQAGGGNRRMRRLSGKAVVSSVLFYFVNLLS